MPTKVNYYIEVFLNSEDDWVATYPKFTSKAAAIQNALRFVNTGTRDNPMRVVRHEEKTEIVWRPKSLRGDTRARKAR